MESEVKTIGIFLDTGFFFALEFKKDPNHQRAYEILSEMAQRKYGTQFTSDFIIDELMTLTWVRTENKNLIAQVWELITPPKNICNVIYVSQDDIIQIYNLFFKILESAKFLSFTDCSNLFMMQKFNLKHLASFDSNFDGLTTRIY
jgi:predicted nucleic acid-binding protein